MSVMSYGPRALKAYLMGRQAAQLMSVDPQTAPVPPEYAADADAYRQGLLDEQSNVPGPAEQSTLPPAPPEVPAAPKSAPVSPEQQRQDNYQQYQASLAKQPVQQIHDAVVDLIVTLDKAMAKSPYFSGALQPQHKQIKEDLLRARGLLADGDRLVHFQDDQSKQTRKKYYMEAYNVAHAAGEKVASASGEDWFLVTAATKVYDSAKSTGKTVLDTGEKVVTKVADTYSAAGKELLKAGGAVATKATEELDKAGGTVKTVLYIVAGGAAVAAVGYALVSARRSARSTSR